MKIKLLDIVFEERIDESADHAVYAIINIIKQVEGISNEAIFNIEDEIASIISDDQRLWYKKGFQDGYEFKDEIMEVC